MKRIAMRGAALLLLLLWLPAGALALTGQSISTFIAYYKENLSHINTQQDRHMLPKDLEIADLNDNGRTQYSTSSDTLQVTAAVNAEGVIESCEIRLLYPEGAVQGNSLYQDYIAASYHFVAFVMAMHTSAEAESRAYLVDEIKTALDANNGSYVRQFGVYTISCIRVIGEGAVFTFTNNGLATTETQTETEDGETPAPIEDDEQSNIG